MDQLEDMDMDELDKLVAEIQERAKTPALALCIAILRALDAQEQK